MAAAAAADTDADTDTVARSEPNSEQANRTKIKSKLQRLENKLRKGVLVTVTNCTLTQSPFNPSARQLLNPSTLTL